MRVLFIGDIVGSPGREAVNKLLPELKKEYSIDAVVANAENLAAGKGFTASTLLAMQKAGVEVFTSGNHVWTNKRELGLLADKSFPLLRPANYPLEAPGRGHLIFNLRTQRLLIMNLMGEIDYCHLENPVVSAERILEEEKGRFDLALIDFHAEYTSEKAIFSWCLDGKVNAIVGTHTHIPTADAKILPKGTAFITDVGMAGKKWASLGVDFESLIKHYLTGLPAKHEITEEKPFILNAVVLDLTKSKNQIQLIQREIN